MSLSLPIYLRGRVYVLHTRINGVQFKRSLYTHEPAVAKLRAIQLLGKVAMANNLSLEDVLQSAKKGKKYEIDLERGKFKADDEQDHARMLEAMDYLKKDQVMDRLIERPKVAVRLTEPSTTPSAPSAPPKKSITFKQAQEDFFLFRKNLMPASVLSYKGIFKEFEAFKPDLTLDEITADVLTEFAKTTLKNNSNKTLDKKMGAIRALFNFVIQQQMWSGSNPAAGRNTLTKAQKAKGGSNLFSLNDIGELFGSPEFHKIKLTEPRFYYIILLGLGTGARVSALASLTAKDFQVTPDGTLFIRIKADKTASGVRDVPIPKRLWNETLAHVTKHKGMGYAIPKTPGKGFSDPVRKSLDNFFTLMNHDKDKKTFHGLRKTFNTEMMNDLVPIEVRCQFIGHEFDHVNPTVYGFKKYPLKEVAKIVGPIQHRILTLANFI